MLSTTVLDSLPVTRRSDADTSSKGDKLSQGSNLHFLHNPVPVSLDRAHRRYQHVGYRLVAFAANDKFKDLPLPRRQCRDTRENCVSRLLLLKHRIVMRNGPFDSFQKLLGCYRLDRKSSPPALMVRTVVGMSG